MEKRYTCQICKSGRATGVWLLKKKSGHEVKLLCTPCWFTELPQRSTVLELVFLQSLLAPETHNESPECEKGLIPTGEATILKTMTDAPALIGVFFEMRCPRCGFCIDLGPDDVNTAKITYLHPNKLYADRNKES